MTRYENVGEHKASIVISISQLGLHGDNSLFFIVLVGLFMSISSIKIAIKESGYILNTSFINIYIYNIVQGYRTVIPPGTSMYFFTEDLNSKLCSLYFQLRNLPPHLPELSRNSFAHVLHVTTPVVAWAVQAEQCVGHSAITIIKCRTLNCII